MATTSTIHTETGTGQEANTDQPQDLHDLTTESSNEASMGFDTKSALEIARIINHEDSKIAAAVKKSLPEIALVIDMVARSLRDGGRLIYVGAGSSGRIAGLDSSECPPTFSTPPQSVQYIMAGGPKALASAVEVNEDSTELGQRDIARRRPTRKDVVIGLSSSGRTPYVVAAVEYARARGAKTAAVTCNHNTPLSSAADICIVAEVGPEVVSGSTRMKAATAQKMVLNMITTGRHDTAWLCLRQPHGQCAHAEHQAGGAWHQYSDACLPYRPRTGRAHHQVCRAQRAGCAGDAQGRSRQT